MTPLPYQFWSEPRLVRHSKHAGGWRADRTGLKRWKARNRRRALRG